MNTSENKVRNKIRTSGKYGIYYFGQFARWKNVAVNFLRGEGKKCSSDTQSRVEIKFVVNSQFYAWWSNVWSFYFLISTLLIKLKYNFYFLNLLNHINTHFFPFLGWIAHVFNLSLFCATRYPYPRRWKRQHFPGQYVRGKIIQRQQNLTSVYADVRWVCVLHIQ